MARIMSTHLKNPGRFVTHLLQFRSSVGLVSSSTRWRRVMAFFRYVQVCATKCELALHERIYFCQSTNANPASQYLVIDEKNWNKHKLGKYSLDNNTWWLLNTMEPPEDPKPKCEKCLPFRKRSHNRYCTEESTPDPPQTSQNENTTEEGPSGEVKSSSSRTNIQEDFENLHLMTEDPGGTSCIPLTVESLPSTSSTSKKSPFLCTFCRKKFHHKGDMNKHLRSHTKEQPYKCTYCSSKFSHTSNLQRHLRIHTGCKPHTCEYCNRNFSRIDKLHIHQKNGVCRKNKED